MIKGKITEKIVQHKNPEQSSYQNIRVLLNKPFQS